MRKLLTSGNLTHISSRSLFGLFGGSKIPEVTFTVFAEGQASQKHLVKAKEGANLMDTLNDSSIKDISVFGICDKQLACLSCRINISKSCYPKLAKITEDEQDVLDELGALLKPGQTRMSCQLKVSKEMEGCEIEIPRTAFGLYEKLTKDD
ncbi:hypothetical protein FGO68_gene761 [Halteria grandinella]|uniref:Ferredoxin n=1 Tax=Halteria grandinella TaxID=5974 RepID=A0A8J8NIM2_HALGN|nr:hypothetical protein FGO68_gene761 [Halteria grandinella]